MPHHPMKWHDAEQPTTPFLGGDDAPAAPPSIGLPVAMAGLRSVPEFGPGTEAVTALLRDLLVALRHHRAEQPGIVLAAGALDAVGVTMLDQVLGQGEVSLVVTGACEYHVQESVLTGVWRVRTFDAGGQPIADHVEIADIPRVVRAAARGGTTADLPITAAPPGAMNVMPLLTEIQSRMAGYHDGMPNHVISFSLLPVNEIDMRHLRQVLGAGPIEMVSRGYGTCRVAATACRHVWSVQFLNVMDVVILDTLEIGDVPLAVRAADEDFEDSAVRLEQILEAYVP
ncbi:MAG: hydrogenase expression/formation C-terminal domain-containing protein [Azospirillaceae bacterium]|nr:hydrogenase expression/formation C-terminal domain-containing protein [Azospirillaceae bacterium]